LLTLSAALWVAPYLASFLRIPAAPVEILLGSLLAWIGLIGYHAYFDLIANVGFLYLMFLVGLEVNLKQITGSPRSTLKKSVAFHDSAWYPWRHRGDASWLNSIVILTLPLISIGLLASLSKTYGKEAP